MNNETLLNYFLPSEIINNFDLVKIKEQKGENYIVMHIFFDEKPVYPDGFSEGELESRGFYPPVKISDFPIRNKKVILNLRQRKWRIKKNNKIIKRKLEVRHEHTTLSKEFALFLKNKLDKNAVSTNSVAKDNHISNSSLAKIYKTFLSGFADWDQKEHSVKWVLFPENIGQNICIDETSLTNGELYTIVTNADAKTQEGCLIAMIEGVKSSDIIKCLKKIPIKKRKKVLTATLDLANNMEKGVRGSFPNAELIVDRFHVAKLISDAVQKKRIEYRWEAIDEENEEIEKLKKEHGENYKYIPSAYGNDDTKKQLLARSRYLLFKPKSKWTESQKQRAKILFNEYPDLETIYNLSMMFRNIYETCKSKKEATKRYLKWYEKVDSKGIKVFNTVMKTIKNHEEKILNFFNERRTNCLAETFNSKIKAFRSVLVSNKF